jgi:hypothetical protein
MPDAGNRSQVPQNDLVLIFGSGTWVCSAGAGSGRLPPVKFAHYKSVGGCTGAMRPLTHWVCLALGAAVVITVARAQPTDNSLQIYVVRMLSGPEQNPGGAGIYIGNGLVITAAHVAGPSVRGVRIKGLNVPAKPVKVGTFPQLDLALISMDKETLPISLRLRRMPLCQRQAPIGASVIVAAPQAITRSRIMSPMLLLPPDYQVKFPTLISDVRHGREIGFWRL